MPFAAFKRGLTAAKSLDIGLVPALLLAAALVLTFTAYVPGLRGGWLLDDYPNIVENHAIQPEDSRLSSLANAALSSTAGEFKRPLSSLSFALNYRMTGLDPFWMKLTNLLIHLFNGALVFALSREMVTIGANRGKAWPARRTIAGPGEIAVDDGRIDQEGNAGSIAALVAAAWMLLPINLSAVLYVVQRMESLANLFVLLGLLGYVVGRRRMLFDDRVTSDTVSATWKRFAERNRGFALCAISITIPTLLGAMAKETAIMLPLYAALVEWALFRGRCASPKPGLRKFDRRIAALFAIVLVLPMLVGLVWLLPIVLRPSAWAQRDFSLGERLLSECRIVLDYVVWTVIPNVKGLAFYHDNFHISSGLFAPWTTVASIFGLSMLVALILHVRDRFPLATLGLALFLGSHLLTGTIVPLELIYEHRNYFGSFGLMLCLVSVLSAPDKSGLKLDSAKPLILREPGSFDDRGVLPFKRLRYILLGALFVGWMTQTASTAYAWGSPLRLTQYLAARSPNSPRAQYDLGRTYSIYSEYDSASRYASLADATLERAAGMSPESILPEQALIFMHAKMHTPSKDAWWDSLIRKLRNHAPTAENQAALRALSTCQIQNHCDLPRERVIAAYRAALAYPQPGAQLQARYGEYAWNVLDDKNLGISMMAGAARTEPAEPDYAVALINMLVTQGRIDEAKDEFARLQSLNVGGRLDETLTTLSASPDLH